MRSKGWKSRAVRFGVGVAISALFVAVTLTRVDIRGVIRALQEVQPGGLAIAFVLIWLEIALRAWRWQLLLAPIQSVRYRSSFIYLCVGYFANSLLPARLGDVARAYLAGTALGISRLVTLGSILVERLADGASILVIVIAVGTVIAGGAGFAGTAWVLLAAALAGGVALAVAAMIGRRSRIAGTRPGIALRTVVQRLLDGAVALRSVRGFVSVAALTIAAFGVAVCTLDVTAAAIGIRLSPLEAVLVMGALALSTSLPAAPGSLGTYEFVGVAVLTALGAAPEPALATVLLVHVLATVPPALTGLVATWAMHVRVGALVGEVHEAAVVDAAS